MFRSAVQSLYQITAETWMPFQAVSLIPYSAVCVKYIHCHSVLVSTQYKLKSWDCKSYLNLKKCSYKFMICTPTGQSLLQDLTQVSSQLTCLVISTAGYVSNYSIILDDFTHLSLNQHSAMSFLLLAPSFSLKKATHSKACGQLWHSASSPRWSEMFIPVYPITKGACVISRIVGGSLHYSPLIIARLLTIWIDHVMCKVYSILKATSIFQLLTDIQLI